MAVIVSLLLAAIPALPGQAQTLSRKELGTRALRIVVDHLRSEDSDVRALAVRILGEAGNKAAAGTLRNMLGDRDKYVRIAAARALWELGSPAGLKTVTGIIDDVPAQGPVPVTNNPLVELKIISQNKVREKAIETYAWMKGEKASPLLYRLKNDAYGPVRDAAARELARLGRTEELSQFTEALSDEDEAIRFESCSVLAKICHPGAAEPLAKLLASETSVRVRMAALDALRCSPARKDAVDLLIKLSEDENHTVKYKAVQALGGIRDAKAKARLAAVAGETQDIRLRIAAQRGLVLAGDAGDLNTVRDAMTAATPETRLDAVEVAASFQDDDAFLVFAQALDDADTSVKLNAALQILRKAARK